MAETDRISADTLLNSLHPNRLPEQAAGGILAELLVCIGIGLILGAVVAALLPKRQSIACRLKALQGLDREERRLAMLYLLRDVNPLQIQKWRGRLYQKGDQPDADEVEGLLR